MYRAEDIAPKLKTKRAIPFLWYVVTTLAFLLVYPLLTSYIAHQKQTTLLIILAIFIIVILVQELLANQYIKIFPYWSFILIVGTILGIISSIILLGAIFSFPLLVGIFTTSLKGQFGNTVSVILSGILIPLSGAVVFLIITIFFWYGIVKPIQKSEKISEKKKLLFEGIVMILVIVFVTINVYLALILISLNNFTVAYLITSVAFSYFTFSSFKEICSENLYMNVFKENN